MPICITKRAQDLADYIIRTELKPIPLPQEFFYASLPLCVIDAVFSIGVSYTSTSNTVARFCDRQGWVISLSPNIKRQTGEHTISDFLNLPENLSPDRMADTLFGNRQRTSTRSGILKADAVRHFATSLQEAKINDFCDLDEGRLVIAEALAREIPGQKSGISFDYFRMLAGDDNLVKPISARKGYKKKGQDRTGKSSKLDKYYAQKRVEQDARAANQGSDI